MFGQFALAVTRHAFRGEAADLGVVAIVLGEFGKGKHFAFGLEPTGLLHGGGEAFLGCQFVEKLKRNAKIVRVDPVDLQPGPEADEFSHHGVFADFQARGDGTDLRFVRG